MGLPLRLFYPPLPLGLLCCKLGLQYLIQKLEYKAIICKYQWMTKTTEITWNCSFNICIAVGCLCMGGAELVPLSRDRTTASVGTTDGTRRLSPTWYRPCILPSPLLTTLSPSRGSITGSKSGPRTSLAVVMHLVMRDWIFGLLYASGGSSTLKVTSALALPLCAMPYAWSLLQG
jgi:hypothetical protein